METVVEQVPEVVVEQVPEVVVEQVPEVVTKQTAIEKRVKKLEEKIEELVTLLKLRT